MICQENRVEPAPPGTDSPHVGSKRGRTTGREKTHCTSRAAKVNGPWHWVRGGGESDLRGDAFDHHGKHPSTFQPLSLLHQPHRLRTSSSHTRRAPCSTTTHNGVTKRPLWRVSRTAAMRSHGRRVTKWSPPRRKPPTAQGLFVVTVRTEKMHIEVAEACSAASCAQHFSMPGRARPSSDQGRNCESSSRGAGGHGVLTWFAWRPCARKPPRVQ